MSETVNAAGVSVSGEPGAAPVRHSVVVRAGWIAGVIVLYVVLAVVSRLLRGPGIFVAPFWPPAGVALAAALLLGRDGWLAVFLASLLVSLSPQPRALGLAEVPVAAVAVANALQAMLQAAVGAWLVRRQVGFPTAFVTVRSVLGLVVLGGVVPVLGRILLSRALRWASGVPMPDDPAFSFFLWWISETMGVTLAAPLLALWGPGVETTTRRRRVVTATLACAVAGAFVIVGRALTLEQREVETAFQRRALVLRALVEARGAAIVEAGGSLPESGGAVLTPDETEGLVVWLEDSRGAGPERPVWRSDPAVVPSHSGDALFHWESPVVLGARPLLLHVSQALPPRPWQTWALPVLLLAFSCAFVVLLLVTTGRVELTEAEVRQRTAELERALGEVKTLRSLLPVCAGCKKVRDDEGLWRSIEEYLWTHADVMVSHGLCPTCLAKMEEQG
jgi:integral membrane sensor domain MASE1